MVGFLTFEGYKFVRLGVSFLTFAGYKFLPLGITFFLCFGVTNSYVWGLQLLTFGG